MYFNASFPMGGMPVGLPLGAQPLQPHSGGAPTQPQQAKQTENSMTRILSPPRHSPSKAMIFDHVLASGRDEAFTASQDVAGKRWTQQSGFNSTQIQEFQMLLDLIRPIMVKPSKIVGAREIAKGSFGTIYSAMFNEMKVAVKRINQDRSKSLATKMREAYLELNIMNDLSHPNVVQLVGVSADFKSDNPQNFYFGIVLELCSDSLQKNLLKKKYSFADRMNMSLELVHGVSYIHSKGIVHRDLSSQNILLTYSGHVKIADFGCARKINQRGEYKTSSITGSPAYMAPEQLEGHILTLKCDVWAVGVNLWELATQKLPWADEAMRESTNGLADYEYMKRTVRGGRKLSRPAPGMLNTSVAEPYYQLVLSCHHKDPSQRPSSSQILSALHDILSASSDANLKRSLHINKEMQRFFAAPNGIMDDNGEPAPYREDKIASVTRRLFKFYLMYNPEKMYDVPGVAGAFFDKQDQLNASLRKRYNADLNTYPLSTPPSFKNKSTTFHSPYANHKTKNTNLTPFISEEPENQKSPSKNLTKLGCVDKDNLMSQNVRKSIHAVQSRIGGVETYSARQDGKKILESAKTWDEPVKIQDLLLPGHEAPDNDKPAKDEHEAHNAVSNAAIGSENRTKTILTLMGTIKLLEARNSELLKYSKDIDAELQQERHISASYKRQVVALQQQLSLKKRHEEQDAETIIMKENRGAINQAVNKQDMYGHKLDVDYGHKISSKITV